MRESDTTLRADEVVRRRRQKGWSQETLAAKVGCGVRTIQRAEAGAPVLTATASEIAQGLGCELSDIVLLRPDSVATVLMERELVLPNPPPAGRDVVQAGSPSEVIHAEVPKPTSPTHRRRILLWIAAAFALLTAAVTYAAWPLPHTRREALLRSQILFGRLRQSPSDVVEKMKQLSLLYADEGRYDDAVRNHEQLVAVLRRTSPYGWAAAVHTSNLAFYLARVNRCQDALLLLGDVMPKILAAGRPTDVARSLLARAECYLDSGRLSRAEIDLRQAMSALATLREGRLKREREAEVLGNMAVLMVRRRQWDKARRVYSSLLGPCRANTSGKEARCGFLYHARGVCLWHLQRRPDAEGDLRKAVALYDKVAEPKVPNAETVRCDLALVLWCKGDPNSEARSLCAKPLSESACRIQRRRDLTPPK